jgi:hypothetical protein
MKEEYNAVVILIIAIFVIICGLFFVIYTHRAQLTMPWAGPYPPPYVPHYSYPYRTLGFIVIFIGGMLLLIPGYMYWVISIKKKKSIKGY